MTKQAFGLLMASPTNYHQWQGESGQWWRLSVHSLQLPAADIPCVYIIARRGHDGQVTPVYIGQTDCIGRRFSEHLDDKLPSALWLGANELHVIGPLVTRAYRFDIETDLRRGHPTAVLNRQAVKPTGLLGLL